VNTQCRCPYPHQGPQGIGIPLGTGVIGQWQPLPLEANRQEATQPVLSHGYGDDEYSLTHTPTGSPRAHSVYPPPIPVLPLTVEYEDDDAPSDDHEYVSVKITELADMVSVVRSCTCQDG
jgi:hypothetical protein